MPRNTSRPSLANLRTIAETVIEQIQGGCRAIEVLRVGVSQKNPRNFAVLAEGSLDEIRKLQADIDD